MEGNLNWRMESYEDFIFYKLNRHIKNLQQYKHDVFNITQKLLKVSPIILKRQRLSYINRPFSSTKHLSPNHKLIKSRWAGNSRNSVKDSVKQRGNEQFNPLRTSLLQLRKAISQFSKHENLNIVRPVIRQYNYIKKPVNEVTIQSYKNNIRSLVKIKNKNKEWIAKVKANLSWSLK